MDAVPRQLDTKLGSSFVGVCAAFQALFLCRAIFLCFSRRDYLLDVARSILKTFVCSGCGSKPADVSATEDEQLVNQQICELRLQMARLFMRYTCALLGFFLFFQQLRVLQDADRWISNNAMWLVVASFGASGFVNLFSALLTVTNLDVVYVVISLCCTVQLSPWHVELADATLTSICILGFARLPAIAIAGRPILVVALNAAPLALVSCRSIWEEVPPSFVNAEISGFLVTSLASLSLQAGLKRRTEHDLLYSKMATNLKAASSLLGLTCDAVVELDGDLRVVQDSAALAAMLLCAGSTLAGRDFRDFVQKSDADQALELLKRFDGSQPDVNTQAFHTRLQDCDCNKIPTEVFQVVYRTTRGEARHLIGLRDVTDQGCLVRGKSADSSDIQLSYPMMPVDTLTPMTSQSVSTAAVSFSATGPQALPSSQRNVSVTRVQNKLLFMQMDMDRRVVSTSSRAICVGRTLVDLFSARGAEVLQSAWAEASESATLSMAFRIKSLYLQLSMSAKEYVSGTLQLVQTASGSLQLMLLCLTPPSLEDPMESRASSVRPLPDIHEARREGLHRTEEEIEGFVRVSL
ncbi:unnamed protein product [Symbiodinium necroappetens]|uniref:PAS domain-containing protein n=1 Tax=Symbiodinium necroappetens TaxID=1628268 RepID=A0A812SVT0_9DINO|nr:unnamed protein product [Symbiodinium necroappetens]